MKVVREHTKVSQLELSWLAQQQILRFYITVKDPSTVAESQTTEQLKEKEFHIFRVQPARMPFQVLWKIRVLREITNRQ